MNRIEHPIPLAWIVAVLAAATGGACRRVDVASPSPSAPPDRYAFLQEVMLPMDRVEEIRRSLPYARIEYEEDSTWWGGRSISIDRDGSITRDGKTSKPHAVSIFDYGELCRLVESIGFESMSERYSWDGFDASTFTFRVWKTGSEVPIQVEDYGLVGPVELNTLRNSIDGVASRAR